MISCLIKEILDYNAYKLRTKDKEYNLVLEFYGVDKPNVGDMLLIHELLLDPKWENYTQPYAFEVKTDVSLKKIKDDNNEEFIVLRTRNKNYALRRIYG